MLQLWILVEVGLIYAKCVKICSHYKLYTAKIQCNKGVMVYIDVRPKALGNIARLINSKICRTTRKKPNFIFEGHEGN
jgi:hypothetical protein